MLKGLEHVGIAVSNLDEALTIFEKTFGLKVESIINVKEQGTRVAILPLGGTKIELLEPMGEGPLTRFLEKRGEGLHHIAFEVSDIHGLLKGLKDIGIQLLDEVPRIGAEGFKIAFLHPRSTRGVLIELCEKPSLIENSASRKSSI